MGFLVFVYQAVAHAHLLFDFFGLPQVKIYAIIQLEMQKY